MNSAKRLISSILVLVIIFAFVSCDTAEKPKLLTEDDASRLVEEIKEADVFSGEMIPLSDNAIANLFGFLDEGVWKTGLTEVSGAKSDELIIVNAATEEKLDSYYRSFEFYLEDRKEQFENYAPAEMPKLNSAILRKEGTFLIYCVCKDSEKVISLIENR